MSGEGGSPAQTRRPSSRHAEVSPLPSQDTGLLCPSPPRQDAETPADFSPPASALRGPSGPEASAPRQPPVQHQASLPFTKALFAPKQQIQPPESQVQVQAQVQVQLARSSVNSPSPLQLGASVPQQQPRPPAAGLSKDGHDSAAQQHKQHSEFYFLPPPTQPPTFIISSVLPPEPTAALETKSPAFTPDVPPASPAVAGTQAHVAPGPPESTPDQTKVRPGPELPRPPGSVNAASTPFMFCLVFSAL